MATCGAVTTSSSPTTADSAWSERAISGAWGHYCVAHARKAVCFPYREPGPDGINRPHRTIDLPFDVASMHTTGRSGACVASAHGRVACWGARNCDPYTQAGCERLPLHELPAAQSGYRSLAWAGEEVCILEPRGVVRCAPRSELRQGMTPGRWLERVPDTRFIELTSGGGFCALADSGDVWCWGEHWGRDFLDPFRVQLLGPATDLVANVDTMCAIVNGAVVCWGRYPDREAAPPPSEELISVEGDEVVPIRLHRVRGLPRAVRLLDAVGGMIAITPDGAAWFWGGGYGGLRDGAFDPAMHALDQHGDRQPKRIVASGVVDGFSVGFRRPCFVLENGHLHCDEAYRGMGLEALATPVCYFDGPETRASVARGERLDPPPSSTCD